MSEIEQKLHRGLALIEVDDPFILAEIENDAALQPILGDRLSDRGVVVQAQDAEAFKEKVGRRAQVEILGPGESYDF